MLRAYRPYIPVKKNDRKDKVEKEVIRLLQRKLSDYNSVAGEVDTQLSYMVVFKTVIALCIPNKCCQIGDFMSCHCRGVRDYFHLSFFLYCMKYTFSNEVSETSGQVIDETRLVSFVGLIMTKVIKVV